MGGGKQGNQRHPKPRLAWDSLEEKLKSLEGLTEDVAVARRQPSAPQSPRAEPAGDVDLAVAAAPEAGPAAEGPDRGAPGPEGADAGQAQGAAASSRGFNRHRQRDVVRFNPNYNVYHDAVLYATLHGASGHSARPEGASSSGSPSPSPYHMWNEPSDGRGDRPHPSPVASLAHHRLQSSNEADRLFTPGGQLVVDRDGRRRAFARGTLHTPPPYFVGARSQYQQDRMRYEYEEKLNASAFGAAGGAGRTCKSLRLRELESESSSEVEAAGLVAGPGPPLPAHQGGQYDGHPRSIPTSSLADRHRIRAERLEISQKRKEKQATKSLGDTYIPGPKVDRLTTIRSLHPEWRFRYLSGQPMTEHFIGDQKDHWIL